MRAQMRIMVKLRPVIHGTFAPRVHQARCSTVTATAPKKKLEGRSALCETNVRGCCPDISHGKQVIASNEAIFCALAGREVGSVYSLREQSGCACAIPYEGMNGNGEGMNGNGEGTTGILAREGLYGDQHKGREFGQRTHHATRTYD